MASEAMVDLAEKLYDSLQQQSTLEKVGEKEVRVFRGSVTEVSAPILPSSGYYTPVWNVLRDQGCIDQLQRGAKGVETVLLLNHPPDHAAALQTASRKHLTRRQDLDKLASDVEAIGRTLGGIDIREALRNHEERLRVLEAEREEK